MTRAFRSQPKLISSSSARSVRQAPSLVLPVITGLRLGLGGCLGATLLPLGGLAYQMLTTIAVYPVFAIVFGNLHRRVVIEV